MVVSTGFRLDDVDLGLVAALIRNNGDVQNDGLIVYNLFNNLFDIYHVIEIQQHLMNRKKAITKTYFILKTVIIHYTDIDNMTK